MGDASGQSSDANSETTPPSGGISHNTSGGADHDVDLEHEHQVDWWNVTNNDETNFDSTSLPLDVWNPLLPHDTGRKFSPTLI